MKFTYKKILFAVTALFIIALIPFIQSCSNNNELEGTEKIESSVELTASEKIDIINSKEFTEYTEANIEVASMFQKLDSASKSKKNIKVGVNPYGVKYKTYPFTVNKNLFDVARVKGDALHKKFPTLMKISYNEMKGLVSETILKSSSIRQKLITKGLISKRQNVRQKIGINEGNGVFVFTDASEAMYCAMLFTSGSNPKECGGYVFGDGTAILYFYPGATNASSQLPGPISANCEGGVDVSYYNGQQIQSTFHVQFNASYPSSEVTNGIGQPNDLTTQSNYFPNCSLIILYQNQVYEYCFEDGYVRGRP
jgi:hypothetical protein